MKQTSKVVLGIVLVLVLVVAGGVWFLYSNLDRLVAGIIERQGSQATQTHVTVGSVSIDLRAGSAAISRLAVANPEGFSNEPAISLDEFAIDLDPMAVTSDPLVIERVTVNGARLLVEQQGTRNNLKTIMTSLERQASEPAPAEEEGRKLIIQRFEVSDSDATLSVPGLNEERRAHMPKVVLTDIGRKTNGATAAALAEQLLGPLIEMALESAAERGVGEALRKKLDEAESDVAEDLLERLGEKDTKEDDQP
ncbi:MAG TPA: hypothetical protein VE175_12600 [Woeseiaceae bacterium]|nr:hypothetical protein [Woeseiaceae bacterium]